VKGPIQLTLHREDGPPMVWRLAESARSLARELGHRGFALNTRCGERGLCRGCEVEVLEGSVEEDGVARLAPARVRACRCLLVEAAEIHLPKRSLLENRPQVEDSFVVLVPVRVCPAFEWIAGVRDVAFAVDIGTTTVALMLLEYPSGKCLSKAGAFNAQISQGDNVITRIEASGTLSGRESLKRAILQDTLEPLLREACRSAGVSVDRLAGGCVAGNTTMLHLLCGVDPTPMGFAPFTPGFLDARRTWCAALGWRGPAGEVPVQLLPSDPLFTRLRIVPTGLERQRSARRKQGECQLCWRETCRLDH